MSKEKPMIQENDSAKSIVELSDEDLEKVVGGNNVVSASFGTSGIRFNQDTPVDFTFGETSASVRIQA